jgi:hypothetical protein
MFSIDIDLDQPRYLKSFDRALLRTQSATVEGDGDADAAQD